MIPCGWEGRKADLLQPAERTTYLGALAKVYDPRLPETANLITTETASPLLFSRFWSGRAKALCVKLATVATWLRLSVVNPGMLRTNLIRRLAADLGA